MWTAIFEALANNESFSSAVRWNLLLGDVLATIAVGCGIVWEHGPEDVRKVADKLVLWGIVAETLFSVALFTVDGGISDVQQSKIITLETRLAPRIITGEQDRRISEELKRFAGTKFEIVTYGRDTEVGRFSKQLESSLTRSGWLSELYDGSLFSSASSIALFISNAPKAQEKDREAAIALIATLQQLQIETDPALGEESTFSDAAIKIVIGRK